MDVERAGTPKQVDFICLLMAGTTIDCGCAEETWSGKQYLAAHSMRMIWIPGTLDDCLAMVSDVT